MEFTISTKKTLDIKDGMILDVTMHDEQVLFSGRVQDFDGDTLYLVSPSGSSIPSVTFGAELKLRCHKKDDQVSVYHGTVLGSKSTMWKVGELCDWYGWERRSFYRQSLSIEAQVLRTKRVRPNFQQNLDVKVDCRLLDISGGGTLLGCSQAVFDAGDQLHITNAVLIPGERPFSFLCVVKRVDKARFNNIYGCQFVGLDAKEEDRLARAVFQLQIQERRRRAGMDR